MSVVTPEEFISLSSKAEFSSPVKGKGKKEYRSQITYPLEGSIEEGEKIYLQTPPLTVHQIEDKKTHLVLYSNLPLETQALYASIRGIEVKFLHKLVENPSWLGFETTLKYTYLHDFFSSSLLLPDTLESPFGLKLNLPLDQTLLFDKGGRKISLDQLKPGQNIVFLLELSFVLYHNQKIYLPLIVPQARIYDPPEKDSDLLIEFSP